MPRRTHKKRMGPTRVLPESEEEQKPIVEEHFRFFWKSESPFSQWHNSKYVLNGVAYSCAEQGMMHGKALLFEDYETAKEILQTNNPGSMKALGRKVRGFNDKVWRKNRERIVYENSVAKFTQNPHLLEAMMNTNGLLVEASPNDAIWGIGLAESIARNMSPQKWPGHNLLGKILTRVREDIRSGTYDELLPAIKEEE